MLFFFFLVVWSGDCCNVGMLQHTIIITFFFFIIMMDNITFSLTAPMSPCRLFKKKWSFSSSSIIVSSDDLLDLFKKTQCILYLSSYIYIYIMIMIMIYHLHTCDILFSLMLFCLIIRYRGPLIEVSINGIRYRPPVLSPLPVDSLNL